ncbi:MAG: HDIG domain-containing protein [Candidatus Gastranaerophilales bacterium]
MFNNSLIKKIKAFLTSRKVVNNSAFIFFTCLLTFVIASQNFLFQDVVANGISKRDIIAQKTLTVIDVQRTEQQKKVIAQSVEPILTPAEDNFIKNNFNTLQNSIWQIRKKTATEQIKHQELGILFDFSSNANKDLIINFLLMTDENSLREVFNKSNLTLENILRVGVNESDLEQVGVNEIIMMNLVTDVSKRQIAIIKGLLEQVIVPNLVVDEVATDVARKNAQESTKPYEIIFENGDKILFEGEPVTQLKRDALRQAGYNVYELNWQGVLSIFILVVLGTALFLAYLRYFEKKYIGANYLCLMAVLSLSVAIAAALLPTGYSVYIIPFPLFLLVLSVFTSPSVAFVLSSLLLSIMAIGFQFDTQFVVTFFMLGLFSSIGVSQIRYSKRFDIIKTGFGISLAGLILVLSIYVLEKCLIDVSNILIFKNSAFIFVNGIVSSIIALGLFPLLENVFKIITPYGLAELADHNQPLLKRLQFEAPGTYHHSLMVSNLCEAAAEAVGANPVLARVGAFYHDIGKLKRPLFFVENQSYFGIENPHSKLNPRLSKMVITAHPKDGVDIAKEYGLPQIINNFILQHHGEGLAKYFYNQAIEEEGIDSVKEEQFRYTGPKPNMKETAILMIADAVESAVRSLKTPSADEIDAIIDKIIVERLNDTQLADSPLTLKDLKTIAATFSRILRGMQHNRIKYQETLDEEIKNAKINISSPKIYDEDMDNKIKTLEAQNSSNKDKDENG